MKKIIYLITLSVLVLFSSCTEENITPESDYDIAVVQAFLEPDQEVSVHISKMIPFTEEEYTGETTIDSADVFVNYNGTEYLLSPVIGEPGKYVSLDTTLKANSGDSYNLSFDYNGYVVTSNTTIPSIPANVALSSSVLYVDPNVIGPGSVQNPIIVSWSNPENAYHLIVVEYLESEYNPIIENLDSTNFDQFRKVSTEPILETSYDLKARQQMMFYGTYKVNIYRINEEYVNLYENVSQSSLNLTEPLTNIENGLGIFTGVNLVSLTLEVIEI